VEQKKLGYALKTRKSVLYRILCCLNLVFGVLFSQTAPTKAQDFHPDRIDPRYTCKRMDDNGTAVRMWICVILDGGVMSVKGDLIAVASTDDTSQDWWITAECWSKFVPSGEFSFRTFKTGGISLLVGRQRLIDRYIITAGLGPDSRLSWQNFSENACSWSVSTEGAFDQSDESDTKLCPIWSVRLANGECGIPLNAN
jgi:hypothetical protein